MEEHKGTGRGHPVSDEDFELVTIFRGSQAEALAMRGLLEGQGFHGHVDAQFTKTLDPLITGGNVFDVDLQVPRHEAAEALECLAACREEAARSPAEAAHENSDDDTGVLAGAGPRQPVTPEVFGRRLRWGLLVFLSLLPIMLVSPVVCPAVLATYWVFGLVYFSRVRRSGRRPFGHGTTVACLVFATVIAVLLIGLLVSYKRWG